MRKPEAIRKPARALVFHYNSASAVSFDGSGGGRVWCIFYGCVAALCANRKLRATLRWGKTY